MSAYKDRKYGRECECCKRRWHDVCPRVLFADSCGAARLLCSTCAMQIEEVSHDGE